MLYDKNFLLKLDKIKTKTIYARITALSFSESPLERIEGRITQGSINIDGASAVRRTCSLSMVAQNTKYNNYYWTLDTKFILEIGVQNIIDNRYPEIIWFKQGIFILTSFNTSHSTSGFNISLSGKDKMCLLNGEVSGSLNSSVDFGTIEEEIDGNWVIRHLPLKDIIRNAVHTYGKEPYHNIIIKDLDTLGLELLEYRYDTPMYLYRKEDEVIYKNATLNGDTLCYLTPTSTTPIAFKDLTYEYFESLVDTFTEDNKTLPIYIDKIAYILTKISYGQTAGYRITDLTYAGDLIGNVGDSLTSILDKIKNMLGEFEYFYDVDGQFIFQKKQSFINTLWGPTGTTGNEEGYNESLALISNHIYSFTGGELISAFNNNPNILNMRNDFSIWGTRKSSTGKDIPVHLRYAIDTKPTQYVTVTVNNSELEDYNNKYGTSLQGQSSQEYIASDSDWREIIYIMAKDYYKYGHLDDFEQKVAVANPTLYPLGITGYEHYYLDMEGFWRLLYNPEIFDQVVLKRNELVHAENALKQIKEQGNSPDLIDKVEAWKQLQEKINNGEQLSPEQQYELQILENEILSYSQTLADAQNTVNLKKEELQELEKTQENFYAADSGERKFWAKDIYEAPENLIFWFDFLDTEGELAQFNIKNKGLRTKAINDSNIKSIYFRETPQVIFNPSYAENSMSGYRYIQIPDFIANTMFSISSQGKSAKDKLDELIYQHGYCVESASITAVPIYYLQPNSRIYIHNEDTGLDGDYILSKITIPLGHNGMMSLTVTKAAENII